MSKAEVLFRFQDLLIWQKAIKIADELFDIADFLEKKKLFRFAEQLRGSGLSMPNNIAEGSGSSSKSEFGTFLNYNRRSIYESANMLIIFGRRGYIGKDRVNRLLSELVELSKMTTAFKKKLKQTKAN